MFFCTFAAYLITLIFTIMKNEKQRQILPSLQYPIIADQEPQILSNCRPTAIIRNGAIFYFVLGRYGDTDAAIVFTNLTPRNVITTHANQVWQLQKWTFAELEKLTEWPNKCNIIAEPINAKPLRNLYGAIRVFAHFDATINECKNLIVSKL